ncbi:c-type cytochrome [Pseudomaricurvus sp.]|uniref:c-type cytochrome n=1 Tax=Pseudomaricurvus sp. TaxID=2004510 RepID=UPI003F6A8B85
MALILNRGLKWVVLIAVLAGMVGCGDQQDASHSAAAQPQSLIPDDPQLAEIYQTSCRACHIVPGTGAPLTGDINAWKPRATKGMGTLLDNVINGFGGMPPLGLCMDCSAEEFEALIRFMASQPIPDNS